MKHTDYNLSCFITKYIIEYIFLAIEFQSLITYFRYTISKIDVFCKNKFPFVISDYYLNSTDYEMHLPYITILIFYCHL